jgi:hypothetical protein
VDLNGDGHTDILSGSYSRPGRDMAGLFQVLYGDGKGGFRKPEALRGTDGEPLILPATGGDDADPIIGKICTRPFACDLDGDGKLDLVAGNFLGTFGFFQGDGKGRFAPKASWLERGGEPLKVGMHSDPFLVDWDRDGDLDLLSGSAEGGAFLFVNEGSRTDPSFGARQTLLEPTGHAMAMDETPRFGDAHIRGPQGGTRVWASDVDGDGKLDLLVGDQLTLLHLADGVDREQATAKLAAWNARLQKLFRATSADGDGADFGKKYEALQKEKAKFVREEVTGFVWLLRSK